MLSLSSIEKAFNVPEILWTIIWLTHDCDDEECEKTLNVEPYERLGMMDCLNDHKLILGDFCSVSRIFAGAAIPQLWGYYASIQNLVSLAADVPQSTDWQEFYEENDLDETVREYSLN